MMSCLKESICQVYPCLQELFNKIENSSSLSLMILSAFNLARVLAVKLVEEVLTDRAKEKTDWTDCPKCGTKLHSKGKVSRQITSIIGTISWKRRVGRCPNGCPIGQIAPLDNNLPCYTLTVFKFCYLSTFSLFYTKISSILLNHCFYWSTL